jgi:hypothetical protein
VEDLEVVLDLFINLHDRGDVTASVAVVRSRPDGDEVRILKPEFKSVHDQLMGTGNHIQSVNVVEFRGNLRAEKPSSTTRRNSPGVNIIRVRPHEITVGSFVRDLLSTFDEANLVKSLDIGGKSAMDTEDLTLNNGSSAK